MSIFIRAFYTVVWGLSIAWVTGIAMANANWNDAGDASTASHEDWPMWRYDASRSASSPNRPPNHLNLQWTLKLGKRKPVWDDPLNQDLMAFDRSFEPIIAQGILYVGFNDQDKLVAYDWKTGYERWTFFADGPIRMAPVAWNNHLYVGSDDGHLYCLNATTGELQWKLFGAPNSQRVLGNERLISAWPVRGGPVVRDGTLYYANGIWPFMGTFLYAIDADTGAIQWVNDNTGALYIKQPHSAPAFAGLAPQGMLVATKEHLIVPGGRSVPAVFNRKEGVLQHYELNAGGKGNGGAFIAADDKQFYVHTRLKGTRAFSNKTGVKTAFAPNEPVLDGAVLYSSDVVDKVPVIHMYPSNTEEVEDRKPVWTAKVDATGDLIGAGPCLVAAGKSKISVLVKPTLNAGKWSEGKVVAEYETKEPVCRLVCAHQQILGITESGNLYCFGERPIEAPPVHAPTQALADAPPPKAEKVVEAIAPEIPDESQWLQKWLAGSSNSTYALWFGAANDSQLRMIAKKSQFKQLAIIHSDEEWCRSARRWLNAQSVYGQITVHCNDPSTFRAPPYMASEIVVTDPQLLEPIAVSGVASIYNFLRPYGGTLQFRTGLDPEDTLARLRSLDLENPTRETRDGVACLIREGALPGSANWTHQYGDIGNTIKSNDSRVKLPLGVLWFGASSNVDVLPRHGHGPSEQVVDGRLFIEGMNSLSARDVYTGQVLWKRNFDDLGTFDVYYDSTYEDTPLDPKYNQVHIPGANGRGTNFIVTSDRIYLVVGNECLMMDPKTGADVGKITLPTDSENQTPEWGFIAVYENYLLGGLGFANYRTKHDVEFEEDKDLKPAKAGFGAKSFDRAASRGLIAFDRHSGELLWRVDANHSFWHNGIVAGNGKIYCLDRNPAKIEEAMKRRGKKNPNTYRILALDAKTGATAWEVHDHIFGTWLGYSEPNDALLQAGSQASDRLTDEVGVGMRVYRGATGELRWKNDSLKYAGPCMLHHQTIYTNANAYSESAGAFDLLSGKQKMVRNPITGAIQPWKLTRSYGCNSIIASENFLTFRSGAAGYFDLHSDAGTGNLGGFRSGCTSNLVVANGVLNAPDYTRTCSCTYQNQTSIALIHMPEIDQWSVHPSTHSIPPGTPIETLSLNFGAPGDRRDSEGNLWIEHPTMAGDPTPIWVETNQDVSYFQQHSSSVDSDALPWVYSSGALGVRSLRIGLKTIDNKPTPKKEEAKTEDAAAKKEDADKPASTPLIIEQNHKGRYRVRLHLGLARSQLEGNAVCDVFVQGQLVASEMRISQDGIAMPLTDPTGSQAIVADEAQRWIEVPSIELEGHLELKIVPRQGSPALCGIQLHRVGAESGGVESDK